MPTVKYPCMKGPCLFDRCGYFPNCDEVLSCFVEHMPKDFIGNQQAINLKLGEIKETEHLLKECREGYLNTHQDTNILGEKITSEKDVYYGYDEDSERMKLHYLKKELGELRLQELEMKKDWRKRILEESV